MKSDNRRKVVIIGAGVFGLSLALSLRRRGHVVTVLDKYAFDESNYEPNETDPELSASVDHNKIFRASYGKKTHYQNLALEARAQWLELNLHGAFEDSEHTFFNPCGMLRVQPTSVLGELEKETLQSMEQEGLRNTQFVKSNSQDRERAEREGWSNKLLDFSIPGDSEARSFEAVLDSLAGFTRCFQGCAYYHAEARRAGVKFILGGTKGTVKAFVNSTNNNESRLSGVETADGRKHLCDTTVIAAGSWSTQILPELSYHLESSAGSIATYKIDYHEQDLWDKYSPQRFPVITWKSAPRSIGGKDVGSVYVLPRTPDGLIKIGFRGIKFTNFERAPADASFAQGGKWSIPLSAEDSKVLPKEAAESIKAFVSIFMPDLLDRPFFSSKLCWYTDTLDNSFLIDYVPKFGGSIFVATGGSGHGAKFMPVLGEHAAEIFERGAACCSPMYKHWRWRPDANRGNGLQEGPHGPRNIGTE